MIATGRDEPPQHSSPSNANQVKSLDVIWRVRLDFDQMPGLCVTCLQAQRLWKIDALTAAGVFQMLVEMGYVRNNGRGFVRT
jgi:hypothetical protein